MRDVSFQVEASMYVKKSTRVKFDEACTLISSTHSPSFIWFQTFCEAFN
jgi:hypothetical protein